MDDDVHGNGISVVTTSKVGDQVFFRFVKEEQTGEDKIQDERKRRIISTRQVRM